MQQRSLQQVRVSGSLIFLIHGLIIRNLGFEDSCLSGAPPSFSRRFGQVVEYVREYGVRLASLTSFEEPLRTPRTRLGFPPES